MGKNKLDVKIYNTDVDYIDITYAINSVSLIKINKLGIRIYDESGYYFVNKYRSINLNSIIKGKLDNKFIYSRYKNEILYGYYIRKRFK